MATITPNTTSTLPINSTNLVYDATSAQLVAADGEILWSVTASMFPPAQAGVPPTLSVVEKTVNRVIHPPRPPVDPNAKQVAERHGKTTATQRPDDVGVTVTTTTVTIQLTGSRFAGTQITADFTMTVSQITRSDDTGSDFPRLAYTQVFGGLSYAAAESTNYLGVVTVSAPIPAGTIALPEGGTATLNSGTTASIDIGPGQMKFYTDAGGAAVATGNVPMIGPLNLSTLIIAASGTYDVFGFPDPEPEYEINLTMSQTGGWSVPLPATETSIGALSLAPGNNYDSASIAVGEDTAGNISYLAALALELAPSASTQAQYTLALAGGLAVLGDPTAAPVQVALTGCELVFNFQITPPGATLSGSVGLLNPAPLTTGSIAFWPTTGTSTGTCAIDFFPSTSGAPLVQEASFGVVQALCSLPDAVTRPLPFNGDQGIALVAATPSAVEAHASYIILGDVAPGDTRALISGICMEVTRPVDMMVGSFSFQNCGIIQTGSGVLSFGPWVANQDDTDLRMMVTLPPQHISEAAFPLHDDNTPIGALGPAPVAARMAGATTLMLDTSSLVTTPLSAAALLDWTNYPLVSEQAGLVLEPDPGKVSIIELPYKLLLALDPAAGWVQPPPPDPTAAMAPLWHARLGLQQPRGGGNGLFVNERSGMALAARAPWSWDMTSSQPQQVFATEALTPQNREDIVNQSETTTPLAVDHLILSSLGAWTDLRGFWPASSSFTTAWTQIISQGRDQYIRAVGVGYLLPWGHVASIVEVAERRFSNDAVNTAYLCTKQYIAVAQVSKSYTQQPDRSSLPRDGALAQIDLLTQVTPALDSTTGAVPNTNGQAFWPYVNGQPFLFDARVYDRDPFAPPPGKPADTQLAAIFVDATASDAIVTAAMNAFNAGVVGTATAGAQIQAHAVAGSNALLPGQNTPLTTANFGGQKLALATSKIAGDTTHAVTSLTLQVNSLIPDGTPWNLAAPISNFYPAITQAVVSLPAVGLLTSGSAINTAVSYLPEYLDPSTDGSNPVDAYMQLANPISSALSGAKANGLVAPALAISGLSRTLGALTGSFTNTTAPLQNLLAGNFNPDELFPPGAKLLNLIPFNTIIGALGGLTSFDATHIPLLKVDSSDPTKLVAHLNWTPTATIATDANGNPVPWTDPDGIVKLALNGAAAGSITIDTTITVPVVPPPLLAGTPVTTITATVNSFSLTILDLVLINFDTMTFTSVTGKKPVVQVGLAASNPFVLQGEIDFLQVLFDAIEDLFSGGPSISVDEDAITLSFEFAVPDVPMGIFDLSNIAIGVDVVLSLQTNPIEFHFHYAGPDNPFDLAVDLLGGGGYFLVDASNLANTSITLAAQAGASVSLDLGVASGSVSIMLGAFFQSSPPGVVGPALGGYVRADGQLTVLELISIHVSFYLGVTYAPEEGILWGEASVTVEVSLLFFHKSVSITLRKEFPVKLPKIGAAERPALRAADDTSPIQPVPRDQIMSAADWTTYTQAFA